MIKLLGSLFFILFLFISSSNTPAQQWTDAQKEVWAAVDAYWAVTASDKPMDFFLTFDDSYFGWSYQQEAPGTKADAKKSLGYWMNKGKVMYYTITPARIWVNGDFAYVHYYYTQVTEGTDGKPNTERGRWTDILMKKAGKWMLVGDHGGEIKND
ncbi:MAG: nuclear transport factor 2 family protein [Ignavibacteriaceae bacterium]|nr:nuclear transport factor 2 family protein [Ignavibacteriaceae bacterium]